MKQRTQVAYLYDGSFQGFLSCLYESGQNGEEPVSFSTPEDPRMSLWPERAVETSEANAKEAYRALAAGISVEARRLVTEGFLTCLADKERHLYAFIQMGYQMGPGVVRALADDRVAVIMKAVQHLAGETHLLKGFVRFSDQEGLLISEIEPKNRVLPLLRPHFCARFSGETFVIYDRTHKEALFYQPGKWAILPLDDFQVSAPGETEVNFRRLWRRFYDTIAIEGRYNPKCRMTHMPKRYWGTMTEFQPDEGGPLPELGERKQEPRALP